MKTTLHLPQELADELVSNGLAELYEPPAVKVGGATMLDLSGAAASALIVLGHGADVIAVTGVRPPLRVVAETLCRWRRRLGGNRRYALLAVGPNGQLRYELDERPDIDAVTSLLQTVYEDPPRATP